MAPPLVLFVRVMKTASTMVHSVFERNCGKSNIVSFDCWSAQDAAEKVSQKLTPTTRLVSAHMPFGLHEHVARPTEYITMLRDPVDRVTSLFHHVQLSPASGRWMHLPGATFQQWLDWQRRLKVNTCNVAVRYLSGMTIEDGSGRATGEVTAKHLEVASRNLLERFSVVGVVDRSRQFLSSIGQRYNIPMGDGAPQVNGRHGVPPYGKRPTDRELLPAPIVAAIDDDNRLDLELFRFARDSLAA